jgi:two-component system sensor histidine kinase RegB
VFAWRVVTEEERLNLALAAVQSVLAREQKLSAVGSLAAAAAHELGTPLATIHLVAKEMTAQIPADSPLAEDVALLISQSERCRGILKQLTSQGEAKDVMHERLTLQALFDIVARPHRGLGATIELDVQTEPDAKPLELRRSPEIIHGLGNLIENAVGFADQKVEVRIHYNDVRFEISVRDDGPGFPAQVMARLGEPYVSERSEDDLGGGLGLGFFIAKTLLERTGATVETFNRNPPATGAIVRARWPRSAVEADPLP